MAGAQNETAIKPRREEDFPEWYQQVVRAADLAETSAVRGCMVIKPWGYGIWERIQSELDQRIKATGHENAYFPLFIPLSFLEKEATHVEGFAKECAVVTHHRLEARDGKLVPAGELDEPLIVRPTSETIIGESFSRWVQSYRDLPILINQWANVVRWEMRPRVFLRTAEFLWQEGHTAHATQKEAVEETQRMLAVYRDLIENVLGLAAIAGEKSPGERFPGAEITMTLEAMMQDRKALQAGTSHFLGQNFARASKIQFVDEAGTQQYAFTTSWGVSTRLIGALIMTHGDDNGMRVPPRVAPKHIVVLPVVPKPEQRGQVYEYAERIAKQLQDQRYHDQPIRVLVDMRDKRGSEKNWEWIKKGIPLRVEVGPRDIESESAVIYRRDGDPKAKEQLSRTDLVERAPAILEDIQQSLFRQAREHLDRHIYESITTLPELERFFTPKNSEKPEVHGGFVRAKWCGDPESEKLLEGMKVSIRCLPLKQSGTSGSCVLTGKPATIDAIFAKSY